VKGLDECNDVYKGCKMCTLQSRHMCVGAFRYIAGKRGKMLQNNSFEVSNEFESCFDENSICIEEYFDARRYIKFKDPNQAPYTGYYCNETCSSFPIPNGYKMMGCEIIDIDECELNQKNTCSPNSFCVNTLMDAQNKNGHKCICNDLYFTTSLTPVICSAQGLLVEFFVLYDKDVPDVEIGELFGVLKNIRFDVLQTMHSNGHIKSMSAELLEMSNINAIQRTSASNSTYKIQLKVPIDYVITNTDSKFSGIYMSVQQVITKDKYAKFELGCANPDFFCTESKKIHIEFMNAETLSIDSSTQVSQYADFEVTAVKFDTSLQAWNIFLQIQPSINTRSVVLRKHTANLQNDCGHGYTQTSNAQKCIDSLYDDFHVLENFTYSNIISGNNEDGTILTGKFLSLSSLSHMQSQIDNNFILTLSYDDVNTFASEKIENAKFNSMNFFIAVVDIFVDTQNMFTTVQEVEIATIFGENYILTSKVQASNHITPDIIISFSTVKDVVNELEWNFVTFKLDIHKYENMTFETESDIVLADSVTSYIGFYENDQSNYSRGCVDVDIFTYYAFMSHSSCEGLKSICSNTRITDKLVEFTLPIEHQAFSNLIDSEKFFFVVLNVNLRDHDNYRTSTKVFTKTSIGAHNINQVCKETIELNSDISHLLRFGFINGLIIQLSDIQNVELHNDISAYENVTGHETSTTQDYTDQSLTTNHDIIVDASSPSTLLLSVDHVPNDPDSSYDISVKSIFSMYFVSEIKRDSVMQRIGDGFALTKEGNLHVSDSILEMCPLTKTKGVYGCFSRFEIQNEMYNWQENAIFEVSENKEITQQNSVSWAQTQRKHSYFFTDSIKNHSENVRYLYNIDKGNTKAFVISNDISWELQDLNTQTHPADIFDFAQYSVSVLSVKINIQKTNNTFSKQFENGYEKAISFNITFVMQCTEYTHNFKQSVTLLLSSVMGISKNAIEQETPSHDTIGCQVGISLFLMYSNTVQQNVQIHRMERHLSDQTSAVTSRLTYVLQQLLYQETSHTAKILIHTVKTHSVNSNSNSRRILSDPTNSIQNMKSPFLYRNYKSQRSNVERIIDYYSKTMLSNDQHELYSRSMLKLYVSFSKESFCHQSENIILEKISSDFLQALRADVNSEQIHDSVAVSLIANETIDCTSHWHPSNSSIINRKILQSSSDIISKSNVEHIILKLDMIIASDRAFRIDNNIHMIQMGVVRIEVMSEISSDKLPNIFVLTLGSVFSVDGTLFITENTRVWNDINTNTNSQKKNLLYFLVSIIILFVIISVVCIYYFVLKYHVTFSVRHPSIFYYNAI